MHSVKIALFVLVYLLSDSDFLPAIPGMPFFYVWQFVLKRIQTPNLYTKPISVDGGKLAVGFE